MDDLDSILEAIEKFTDPRGRTGFLDLFPEDEHEDATAEYVSMSTHMGVLKNRIIHLREMITEGRPADNIESTRKDIQVVWRRLDRKVRESVKSAKNSRRLPKTISEARGLVETLFGE